ncbi:MAG: hypothetical protein ACI9BF_000028 [Candidatus Paceibacteria bacterium]|jgi:hypothetical protein
MGTKKTLGLILLLGLLLQIGCAVLPLHSTNQTGVQQKQRSNAHAQVAGEAHIIAVGVLARKLQSEQLCIGGLTEKSSDPKVNISMGITDDAGNVTWLSSSSTSRETTCSFK